MILLLIYAIFSTTIILALGLLPNRGFQFRLLAVALAMTIGFTLIFLTSWGTGTFLHSLPRPESWIPGQWAILVSYLTVASELAPLTIVVVAVYRARNVINRRCST